MNCTVDYEYIQELKTLIRTFKGTVTMSDVIASWEHLIFKNRIPADTNGVISDFRDAELKPVIDEIKLMEKLVSENKNVFEDLVLIQVMKNKAIALPMLFKHHFPEKIVKTFSTIEAAIGWMKGYVV